MGRLVVTKTLGDTNITMFKSYEGIEITTHSSNIHNKITVPSWELADKWFANFERKCINEYIADKQIYHKK
jgi:hypothetical protein